MENLAKKWGKGNNHFLYEEGKWTIESHDKRFFIHNHGWKLCAVDEEGLNKMIFDINNKTIEVNVTKSVLREGAPRKINLIEYPSLFEDIRANIEEILITGGFSSVIPNEDRTIFEIS